MLLIHPGAVANVAYAHHNNNGNVLDEWVFGYQGTPLLATKGKQAESFCTSPPVSSLKSYLCSPNSKIFEKLFEFFYGNVHAELHRPFCASLQFSDLLVGQSIKVIEAQSPSLRFRKFGDCLM